MSVGSLYRQKARFRVLCLHANGRWSDHFGRSFTRMAACEHAERLKLEYVDVKVVHEQHTG